MIGLLPAGLDQSQILQLGQSTLKEAPVYCQQVIVEHTSKLRTYIVFASFSSWPSPAIALNADHKSLTLINVPDS